VMNYDVMIRVGDVAPGRWKRLPPPESIRAEVEMLIRRIGYRGSRKSRSAVRRLQRLWPSALLYGRYWGAPGST
jgi:hypothetical protein